MAGLLTTMDFINAIDNDDAAVRSFEWALQRFNQGRPKVFLICFGVRGATGFVVGVYEGVVSVGEGYC